MTGYFIPRPALMKVFDGNQKNVNAFETQQRKLADIDGTVTASVAGTGALKDASVITLSPNADLTNEYVLAFGRGMTFNTDTPGKLILATDGPNVNGGFSVQFTVAGDSNLSLPMAGVVATREWVLARSYSTGGYTYATAAASYTETATSGEKIVAITATGQTVTLPTAVGNKAKLTYKLMVAGTFTIDGAGAETIDGGLTAVLLNQYEAVTIISDNAGWKVI